MLYYLGVMQWFLKNFAWFFFKTMNVSGAEAVVAAGQFTPSGPTSEIRF